MAEDKKQEDKPVKTQKYKVRKDFTLDKLYRKGETIDLPNGKIKDILTSNNFI